MNLHVGVLLVLGVCLTSAQDGSDCECISYFFCNGTRYDNDKCDGLYNICCEITEDEDDTLPPSIPSIDPTIIPSDFPPTTTSSTDPRLPPATETEQTPLSSGPSLCGVRGSVYDWKVVTPDEDATSAGEFPWMVAIMTVDAGGREKFLCGGSVIYPNIILTTAHNVRPYEAPRLRVKAGVWNTNSKSEESEHQVKSVRARILHSGFNLTSAANDVALLILSENLDITNRVAPICLPATQRFYNSSNCIATGWGASNSGSESVGGELKLVLLPLTDFNFCQDALRKIPKLGPNFVLHRSFICAGGENRDTCKGDGGGPLICSMLDDPNRYVQVGITSWGIGCGVNPGVYSSVAEAAEWIETMADAFPPAVEPTISSRSGSHR